MDCQGKAADQRGGEGRTLSDKIRKYVLPNLPYLFVFWFFSKIGTAYRIAPGTDFGTKLMGMLDTFPKAFETYWPGLGGIDLLVGLAGAAGVYLLIQSKIRQAKKFRRDAEYGTARFGTKAGTDGGARLCGACVHQRPAQSRKSGCRTGKGRAASEGKAQPWCRALTSGHAGPKQKGGWNHDTQTDEL